MTIHEIAHVLGLCESLANSFQSEFTPIHQRNNINTNWMYNPVFDNALKDQVGRENFWNTVFTARNPEQAYARLWNDNFPWLPYETFMKARTTQAVLHGETQDLKVFSGMNLQAP
jgi:hypothetical protein